MSENPEMPKMKTNPTSVLSKLFRPLRGMSRRVAGAGLIAGAALVLGGLTGCETYAPPPDSAFIPEAHMGTTANAPMPATTPAEQALNDYYRTNSAPPAYMKPVASATQTTPPAVASGVPVTPQTGATTPAPALPPGSLPPIVLREGDSINLSFPGAANLNRTVLIRRDGIITLPLIGEVRVAGMTTAELEKTLMEKYKKELVSNEVNVAVAQSTYSLFITGCVIKPGKVSPDRPLNLLEAIMEAGGFDEKKANKSKVAVHRMVEGKLHVDIVDVQAMLKGKNTTPYMMMPSDIVIVKEKLFMW